MASLNTRDLPTALRAFDRRERGFLVAWALDRVGFPVGFEFRTQLQEALPKGCPLISADAFAAMDYEMRWLHAALLSASGKSEPFPLAPEGDQGQQSGDMVWNNEDVDLIIAFSEGPDTHLVMIEAKAYTPWSKKQVVSKVTRLKALFGEGGGRFLGVHPYLVFVGAKPPAKYKEAPWTDWMLTDSKPAFVGLPQPTGERFRATRKAEDSKQWFIEPSKWLG